MKLRTGFHGAMATVAIAIGFGAIGLGSGLFGGTAQAASVSLVNGTATFSQTDFDALNHLPGSSVDGVTTGGGGWAIARPPSQGTTAESAVWETATNITAGTLSFDLVQNFPLARHIIGNFRLSVTSDDRTTFADGLATNGDVDANWTVLTGATVSGPAGMSFSTLADNSILAGGTIAGTGTYNLLFNGSFLALTGIRLEVLTHPSLPTDGPGLFPSNGNFVLSEITLDASGDPLSLPNPVPVPAALPLFLSGLLGLGVMARRRRKACV